MKLQPTNPKRVFAKPFTRFFYERKRAKAMRKIARAMAAGLTSPKRDWWRLAEENPATSPKTGGVIFAEHAFLCDFGRSAGNPFSDRSSAGG